MEAILTFFWTMLHIFIVFFYISLFYSFVHTALFFSQSLFSLQLLLLFFIAVAVGVPIAAGAGRNRRGFIVGT